tara:strand:- start:330 stop:542 length:213 start_codon:yes stop_codon:yes gene_type:complete
MFNFSFNWFSKKEEEPKELFHEEKVQDALEESLWEIKEQYDLPTEEIFNVVELKRRNIEHMHRMLSKKED